MLIETLARGEIEPGTTTGLEAVIYLGPDTVEGIGPEVTRRRGPGVIRAPGGHHVGWRGRLSPGTR